MLSRNQTKPEVYIGPREYLSGDISVYFREFKGQDVNAPRKILSILFQLKTSKITFPEGGDEAASALVLKSMCPFNFPEVSFCFLELPFCFSEVPFYFSKMPYCYPKLPRSNVFFIYCTRLFPRMIFFLLTVTSCPAQSCLQR